MLPTPIITLSSKHGTKGHNMKTTKKSPLGLTCTCCGADITAPKFWKGKPYGFSCYAVVAGEGKHKRGATFAKVNVTSFRLFADILTSEQAMVADRIISAFVVCKDGKNREIRVRFTGEEPTIIYQNGKFYASTKTFNNWNDCKHIYHYVTSNAIRFADFFAAN